MIELITFTGFDATTSMGHLTRLGQQYPKAEFAVLVGSQTGSVSSPLFPSLKMVDVLKKYGANLGFNTAIHLCGGYARLAVQSRKVPKTLLDLCNGFGRIQINLHADGPEPEITWGNGDHYLIQFAEAVTADKVIIQHRHGWQSIPPSTNHEKIEYLYDRSEGRGLEGFDHWPEPSPHLPRMGYAGGIGPHNIRQALAFAERHPGARLWFDMEHHVRNDRGFDLAAVQAVLEEAFGTHLPSRR